MKLTLANLNLTTHQNLVKLQHEVFFIYLI
jgi:hypothetical protein